MGWSPIGATPRQILSFNSGKRGCGESSFVNHRRQKHYVADHEAVGNQVQVRGLAIDASSAVSQDEARQGAGSAKMSADFRALAVYYRYSGPIDRANRNRVTRRERTVNSVRHQD